MGGEFSILTKVFCIEKQCFIIAKHLFNEFVEQQTTKEPNMKLFKKYLQQSVKRK